MHNIGDDGSGVGMMMLMRGVAMYSLIRDDVTGDLYRFCPEEHGAVPDGFTLVAEPPLDAKYWAKKRYRVKLERIVQ